MPTDQQSDRNRAGPSHAESPLEREEANPESASSELLSAYQRRDRQFLVDLGERIRGFDTAQQILSHAAEQVGQYLDVARCTFGDIDLAAGTATVHPGYEPELPTTAGVYPLPDFVRDASQALAGGHIVVVNDAKTDPRTRDRYETAYLPAKARAGVHVPLMRDRGWVGVFSVVMSDVRDWTQREVYLVQTAAERAWLWIEHVRMTEELRALNADLERRVEERTHQIRSSLREKEVLLREIHHRVKNNLQVISSLLNLQAHHLADDSLRQMFQESQSRILSIALVHEKLYQSKDYSHVEFAEYVRSISAQLMHANDAAHRHIECKLKLDDVLLPIDRAIPAGLILNELITNALCHGYPDGRSGELCIRLSQGGKDHVELSVEDDGIGLPASLDVKSSATLGLDLVFTFAEQIDAEVSVTKSPGASFRFRFAREGE